MVAKSIPVPMWVGFLLKSRGLFRSETDNIYMIKKKNLITEKKKINDNIDNYKSN